MKHEKNPQIEIRPRLPLSAILSVFATIIVLTSCRESAGCEGGQGQHATAAESVDQIVWTTGKELDRFVLSSISVSWTDAPLRDRLYSFARSVRVAVFLDRRIDPGTPVTMAIQNQSIERFFWQLAGEHGLGVCRVGDFYYFGPEETAMALPVLWNDLSKLVTAEPQRPISWPSSTEPAKLIERIEEQGRLRLDEDSRLRHDLWPAGELPAMTALHQLAIVGSGFAQWPTYKKSKRLVQFRPLSIPQQGSAEYSWQPEDAESRDETLKQLGREFPDCNFRVKRDSLVVRGSVKSVYNVKHRLVQSTSTAQATSDSQRFTLKTTATRLQIIEAIGRQLARTVDYDATLGPILNQRIAIDCQQVTFDDLMQQILGGTDLVFSMDDSNLKIERAYAADN